MPSLLSSVVEIINAAGQRVDQIVRGHRQPIALRFGAGLVPSSSDRGDNITEVLVVTDTAGGGTHAVATPSTAGFESAADKTALNDLASRLAIPTPVAEAGADSGVLIREFNLPPRLIHTEAGGGYTEYEYDLGTSTFPVGCRANVVLDFEAHGIGTSGGNGGLGTFRLASTLSKSEVTGYLTLVGETAVVLIDAGGHSYQPGTFGVSSGGTRTHTFLLKFGPSNALATDWIIFGHARITYYPGIA